MTKLLLVVSGICCPAVVAAAAPDCRTLNKPGGAGVTVVQECVTRPDAGFDVTDAYYLVETQVEPQAGFGNALTFRRKSPEGKIFAAVLKALLGTEKANSVDIGVIVARGDVVYPAVPLLSFRLDDKNVWTSSVNAESRSFLHHLSAGDDFQVSLAFVYSADRRVSLEPATNLLKASGINLVTPAVEPFLAAAKTFSDALMRSNSLTAKSGYSFPLGPAAGRTAQIGFMIADPVTDRPLAKITVALRGTRSLLAATQDLGSISVTLPVGIVSSAALTTMPQRFATGQASGWPLLNGALASTSTISDVPLGRVPDRQQLVAFCSAAETGLSNSFALSSFDNLLVRAKLVEAVSTTLRPRINPYRICFGDDADRRIIKQSLGIDVDQAEVVQVSGLKSLDAFITLGCLLTGKQGEYCGSASQTRSKAGVLLADQVVVDALEVTKPELSAIGSYTLSRADFVAHFGGGFGSFSDIAADTGTMTLRETADGSALRFSAKVDEGGKITSVSIRRSVP